MKDNVIKIHSINFGDNINATDQDSLEPIAQSLDGSKAFSDFWLFKFDKKSKSYQIDGFYYPGLLERIAKLGFAKKYLNDKTSILIKIEDSIIHEVSVEKIKDAFAIYLYSMGDLHITLPDSKEYDFCNGSLRDIFLKRIHLVINETFLQNISIHKVPLLKDTKNSAYFPFNNGLVEVTKKKIKVLDYDSLKDKCIWKSQLIPHDYKFQKDYNNKIWPTFIQNICEKSMDRIGALRSALGYLLHSYKVKSQTKAVIIYDEHTRDPKSPQGGTGKGILANALKILKPLVKIDGKEFRADDKFHFQQITPGTTIAWLDDPKNNFDFSILYSALTDGLEIERKNQNKVSLSFEDSPKFLISSNVVLNSAGSSNKRRQFIVELSDYYSKKIISGDEEPIADEHNGQLFSENWKPSEWNAFFSFMMVCVQYYIEHGLRSISNNTQAKLLASNTSLNFQTWAENQSFDINQKYMTVQFYNDFLNADPVNKTVIQRTFSNCLKIYSNSKGWKYDNLKSNGHSYFIFSI